MMLKALIIDDELNNRERLALLLKELCPEIELIGSAESALKGYQVCQESMPDVVFLDIQMPGGSGFDFLELFKTISFKIVFVTAYDEHALRAIKFSALDYLLKPLDPLELKSAVAKLKTSVNNSAQLSTLRENIGGGGKIALHTQDEINFVEIADVLYLRASANYTEVHLVNREPILLSKNIGFYEKMLKQDHFFRCHQSYLINTSFIAKYVKTEGGYLQMKNEDIIPISRLKKEELKYLLNA